MSEDTSEAITELESASPPISGQQDFILYPHFSKGPRIPKFFLYEFPSFRE
jgi:hypothetical protein